MSEEWRELKTTDFVVRPGTYQGPSAHVTIEAQPVSLQIDDEVVTPEILELFKSIIGYWIEDRKEIAKQIEKHLQSFLPGKRVDSQDLLLFDITVYCDDDTQRPNCCCLSHTIAGEYVEKGLKLEQFDAESCVEVSFDIVDSTVQWNELTIDINNDLDD